MSKINTDSILFKLEMFRAKNKHLRLLEQKNLSEEQIQESLRRGTSVADTLFDSAIFRHYDENGAESLAKTYGNSVKKLLSFEKAKLKKAMIERIEYWQQIYGYDVVCNERIYVVLRDYLLEKFQIASDKIDRIKHEVDKFNSKEALKNKK